MNTIPSSDLQGALEAIEKLDDEEQETVLEIIKKRLVERRRDEIALHARETLRAVNEKKAKYGDYKDLQSDLTGDSKSS